MLIKTASLILHAIISLRGHTSSTTETRDTMPDSNDHVLRDILRLIQYLQPSDRVSESGVLYDGLFEEIADESVDIAKDLSPPADMADVVGTSTDWVAVGVCLRSWATIYAERHY